MIRIIKTEFIKIKRYSVLWIGVFAILACVLLTRFMATAMDGTQHTLMNFGSEVIWNGFSLIFPATITLIAGYVMERERTDDTLKNISVIPISFRRLMSGKLCLTALLCVALSAVEFVFTLIVVFLSGYSGCSTEVVFQILYQMISMNLFTYIAVLPIIIVSCQRPGFFINGVIFSFFYGFVGIFAAGHGLSNIYPITAGLGLINYQGEDPIQYHKPIALMVVALLLLVSVILLVSAENRIKKEKKQPI